MIKELEEIQKILNIKLDESKDHWNELQKYNEQLGKIKDTTGDMQLGGVKISELNDSMGKLSKFLEGAFGEVNKSVKDINESLNKQKEELKKQ